METDRAPLNLGSNPGAGPTQEQEQRNGDDRPRGLPHDFVSIGGMHTSTPTNASPSPIDQRVTGRIKRLHQRIANIDMMRAGDQQRLHRCLRLLEALQTIGVDIGELLDLLGEI